MAADTYSLILGWLNQGTGNNNNSWGDNCDNSIFPIFEKAIAGLSSHAVTGGTLDLTTDAPPAGPTMALEMIQAFTGTLASDQVVQVPNLSKLWLVYNGTDGAKTLKFKTTSGTASEAIPQGGWCFVFCDGGDSIYVGLSTTMRDVQWLGSDGTLALPGLSFASESTMGLRRVSAGVVAVTIGGVDVATFSADGLNIATGLDLSVGGTSIVPPGTEVNTAAIRAPTGWYLEYGQTVSRTDDAPLMDAITETFTANTNGTTTLSNVSKDLRGLGLEGSVLEGTGIQTATTIVSIDSATQITLSAAATNTATGGAVRAFPFGNGNGVDTFTIPDARGTTGVGRDNMGGTAASRVTFAGSGVRADRLKTIGGEETHTLTTAELAVTTPTATSVFTGAQPSFMQFTGTTAFNSGADFSIRFSSASAVPVGTVATTVHSFGSGNAHNNVQPSRVRNVLIKR